MRAFAYLGAVLIYIAYLDEFGHVGPYVSRGHPRHNDSPVFGFAGFLMPAEEVRAFGTWFYQRKCELLAHELARSGKHPAVWEKKGSSLYRAAGIARYPALRSATNRLLNRIVRTGGRVFYVGARKGEPARHDSNALYAEMLREAVGQIDAFCREDCEPAARFLLALDEHPSRDAVLTAVAGDMYGRGETRRRLIEPPFHLESHRYQTVQAADWIAALVGRLGAFWTEPDIWPENDVFRRYFEDRLAAVQVRSGIQLG
ncbi:MAG: DUF3800 domain-containing protein [Gammaproteobacteria bacterium]|nr:DUF3800 domain-containing protein [Gammaproteobacteria bacterium]